MARKGMLEAEGVVEKILGGGWHDIKLDNGFIVKAKLSGRLRRFRIRVLAGDRVRVEVSEYDLMKGFIVYRLG
jgi:translation initiation factor IF-1